MSDTLKIFLNKGKSLASGNVLMGTNVGLMGKKQLLPTDELFSNLNQNDVYLSEREDSEKIRLIVELNPLCSNILYNNITEVVKDEGSDNVISLHHNPSVASGVYGKESGFTWSHNDAIRDTQLSNSYCGFSYHCGKDIFNTHLLRSNTFKSVAPLYYGEYSNNFNTINDMARNCDGSSVKIYSSAASYFGGSGYSISKIDSHIYSLSGIDTFEETLSEQLYEKNGWFGFKNPSRMRLYSLEGKYLDVNKVINTKDSGAFIDMYPGKNEYSVIPQLNTFRNRAEYNWNYCLTYPSSSTTENIPYIHPLTKGLIVMSMEYDETFVYYHCVTKHNISDGDVVNIYSGDSEFADGQYAFKVDEYTFETRKPSYGLVEDIEDLDLSFKKVDGTSEVEYYMRIFSRLPNWKYATSAITDYNIYSCDGNLLRDCQKLENGFESHMSSMAYAKNIYSDDIGEIVFSDTIDISCIKDNLGRPLTNLYLTVVKNNKGYKQWYGKGVSDGVEIDLNSEDIEFSHCFGKLNCGLKLSDEATSLDESFSGACNVRVMNNVSGFCGLSISSINSGLTEGDDEDEINYEHDISYYGDLCEYMPETAKENVIQPVFFRFNTAQRELTKEDYPWAYENFQELLYDEILRDDYYYTRYDESGMTDEAQAVLEEAEENFVTYTFSVDDACTRPEGYCYNPHFKIPFRTFSPSKSSKVCDSIPFYSIELYDDIVAMDIYGLIYLTSYHDLDVGSTFILFNNDTYEYETCRVAKVLSNDKLLFHFLDEDNKLTDTTDEKIAIVNDPSIWVFLRKPEGVPSYAKFLDDGSYSYVWREVMANGDDDAEAVEKYPFVNDCFYINKKFNLYLQRQDPFGDNDLYYNGKLPDKIGKISKKVGSGSTDNYITDTSC